MHRLMSILANSSISISRSSVGSAPSATASTGDILAASTVNQGIGWEFVHFCIRRWLAGRVRAATGRSAQRECYRLPGGFNRLLRQAWNLGRERVMTDNGSCYRSNAFRAASKRLGLPTSLPASAGLLIWSAVGQHFDPGAGAMIILPCNWHEHVQVRLLRSHLHGIDT